MQIRLAPNRGGILPPDAAICYGCGNNTEELMIQIARRTVLAGAGAGIAAGFVSEAAAQPKPEVQASEYWRTRAR